MTFLKSPIAAALAAGALFAFAAQDAFAAAQDFELSFQEAASTSAERIHSFHSMMLVIITAIVLFVLALLIVVVVKFNAKSHPQPSKTTHHTMLEVIWTVLPVILLIIIAVPSFKLLYYTDRTTEPEMTLKVTGYQWYWGFEYPDNGGTNFMSYLIKEKEIDPSKGQIRLLSTDNPVVLPVETNIRILVTAADVLHSFAMPAFGLKTDAVPGRLNETWVRITKPGVYYGQCSELCGKDHAYMPIEIHAVTKDEFNAWIVQQGGTALGADAAASTGTAEKI